MLVSEQAVRSRIFNADALVEMCSLAIGVTLCPPVLATTHLMLLFTCRCSNKYPVSSLHLFPNVPSSISHTPRRPFNRVPDTRNRVPDWGAGTSRSAGDRLACTPSYSADYTSGGVGHTANSVRDTAQQSADEITVILAIALAILVLVLILLAAAAAAETTEETGHIGCVGSRDYQTVYGVVLCGFLLYLGLYLGASDLCLTSKRYSFGWPYLGPYIDIWTHSRG